MVVGIDYSMVNCDSCGTLVWYIGAENKIVYEC